MESILLRALDLGGTLTIALAILIVGGRKLDGIDNKLEKLMRLTALGFSSAGKRNEVEKILNGK